jgi:hypothetical protein
MVCREPSFDNAATHANRRSLGRLLDHAVAAQCAGYVRIESIGLPERHDRGSAAGNHQRGWLMPDRFEQIKSEIRILFRC